MQREVLFAQRKVLNMIIWSQMQIQVHLLKVNLVPGARKNFINLETLQKAGLKIIFLQSPSFNPY